MLALPIAKSLELAASMFSLADYGARLINCKTHGGATAKPAEGSLISADEPEADIRPPDKLVGARPQTQLKTNLSTEDLKGDEIGNE
jgi:hypothetical protein